MSDRDFEEILEGNSDIVDKAAADWLLAKRFDEQWSAEDQVAFDAWLAQSDAHLLSYWRLEEIWERAHRLKALRTPMRQPKEITPRRTKSYALGLVAVLTVGAMLGVAGTQVFRAPAVNSYSTPVGGHLTLTLADGSKIELNTNSVLKVSSEPSRRFAVLERGEAFFEIVHDAAHPFVVTAAGQKITDLGTKFAVRTESANVRVALIEGSARVESIGGGSKSRATDLRPGDIAVATAYSLTLAKEPVAEIKRDLGWRSGVLIFDNTTLAAAAAELNRYNTTKIIVSDPEISRLSIGGTFRQSDFMALLNTAKQVFGLKVHRRGGDFEITR